MHEFPITPALLQGLPTDLDGDYRRAIDVLNAGLALAHGGGDVSQVLTILMEARQRFYTLAQQAPRSPHHWDWVAECDQARSDILHQSGQEVAAHAAAAQARALRTGPVLQGWTSAEPLCRAYERAKGLNATGRTAATEAALEMFRTAATIMEELAAVFPTCPHYRDWLAANLSGVANRLCQLGRHQEAGAVFTESYRLRSVLMARGWRTEHTQLKLARTLYDRLQQCEPGSSAQSRRKFFERCLECSQAYRAVLKTGAGFECGDRHVEILERTLTAARSTRELQAAQHEITAAQQVLDSLPLQAERELRIATLLADVRSKLQRRQTGIAISRGFQLALCLTVFLMAAAISPALFSLLAFPCMLGLRVIGNAERRFAMGSRRHALTCWCPGVAILVAGQQGWTWPLAMFGGLALSMLVDRLVVHGLQSCLSDRVLATCARWTRRTDMVAEQWALWIEEHLPAWLNVFLLEEETGRGRRLNPLLDLLACSYVLSTDLADLGGKLFEIAADAAAEALLQPKTRPPSRRSFAATTWAILLRRPLHVARGDDVPLCA